MFSPSRVGVAPKESHDVSTDSLRWLDALGPYCNGSCEDIAYRCGADTINSLIAGASDAPQLLTL